MLYTLEFAEGATTFEMTLDILAKGDVTAVDAWAWSWCPHCLQSMQTGCYLSSPDGRRYRIEWRNQVVEKPRGYMLQLFLRKV